MRPPTDTVRVKQHRFVELHGRDREDEGEQSLNETETEWIPWIGEWDELRGGLALLSMLLS
jgi:hypothetical protein